MNSIEKRITHTLNFFKAQHMAVTLLELRQFLVRDIAELDPALSGDGNLVEIVDAEAFVSISELLKSLDDLIKKGEVVQRLGYYTLLGFEKLIEQRWRGYRFGIQRERRIRRFRRALSFLPFVRGVALAGSQAFGLERKESDIDLLVVTQSPWLWLPRTVVTAYFHVLGIRRYRSKIANRVCLNHYISGPKAMQKGRNWYTAFEYAKLRPISGARYIKDFQDANKDWIQSFFPHFEALSVPEVPRSYLERGLEVILGRTIGPFLERVLEQWQAGRIQKDQKHIIVTGDELSFHPNSKQDALLQSLGKL